MAFTVEVEELLEEEEDLPIEENSIVTKKQVSTMSIIALSLLLAVLITTIYIFFTYSLPTILSNENWLVLTTRTIVLLAIGFSIPYGILLFLILKLTGTFFDRFYIPPEETKSRDLILSRLNGYGSRIPIRSEKLSPAHSWLNWWGGPAGLVVNDGFAVYLEKGNRFSRVIGPGISYIEPAETIKAIVDLRPIMRKGVVRAWTKDGIHIQLDVRIECQIGHESKKENGSDNLVYPFYADDVKKAVERTAVRFDREKNSLTESNWVDGVWGKVQGFLAGYISSHTVDELFLAEWGPSQMLSQNASRKVFQDLNRGLVDYGACISNLQITNFGIPEKVTDQRIQTWKAERQSMASITIGQTKAYEIREREEARAEAEREIIASIAKEMEQIDLDRLQETILLSLSGILDQSLSDPMTRTLVTNETLDTLEKLKKLL
jgi:regulator of protease activity HflC (stomatin/prohibitin superfamily)